MAKKKGMTKFFEKDHQRLDELFADFLKYKSTDFPRARECFIQFKFGLLRHMMWEEECLFPVFEEKSGNSFGQSIYLMRIEHRNITRLVEAIHNKIREGDPNSKPEEQQLITFLANHNSKEESILYPAIDRYTTAEEIDQLLNTIYTFPDERYQLLTDTA